MNLALIGASATFVNNDMLPPCLKLMTPLQKILGAPLCTPPPDSMYVIVYRHSQNFLMGELGIQSFVEWTDIKPDSLKCLLCIV
jgi:hypothetical protein